MSSLTQNIGDGSPTPSTSNESPLSAIDKLVNEYIKSVMELPRNEPSITPKAHDKPWPENVTRGHNQPPGTHGGNRYPDKALYGLSSELNTRLEMLRHVNNMDDYETFYARIWAARKRKSMRRAKRMLARVRGTEDNREDALGKKEDDFSSCSDGSNAVPSSGKQSFEKSGRRSSGHLLCSGRGKDGASCLESESVNQLAERVDRARLSPSQQPEDASILRPDNSAMDIDQRLPRSIVTNYQKRSNAYDLRFATEELISTLAVFEDLLPLEISRRIEDIKNACDSEDDTEDDSTLDAFARFILEWNKFPNLSINVAHSLGKYFTISGREQQMLNVINPVYNGRIFDFDEAKMADCASLPKEYLDANWPTYHWVVSSWILFLAVFCQIYHEHRIRGWELPATYVFPLPDYPAWARWHTGRSGSSGLPRIEECD